MLHRPSPVVRQRLAACRPPATAVRMGFGAAISAARGGTPPLSIGPLLRRRPCCYHSCCCCLSVAGRPPAVAIRMGFGAGSRSGVDQRRRGGGRMHLSSITLLCHRCSASCAHRHRLSPFGEKILPATMATGLMKRVGAPAVR
ncbi:hypothetical protein ACLOJK_037199 [Asimina triloba]